MSVNRGGAARKKQPSNSTVKEPLLIVSFEINKPTRPKMTIYEDSDIPSMIQEFIREHKLKSTATSIIGNVINKNLAEMREEEQRLKAKSSRSRPTQGKETKVKSDKLSSRQTNKENVRANPKESDPAFQQQATALVNILRQAKEQEQCEQVGMAQLQQEFERQFKSIRANRMLKSCQRQLIELYQRLTRLNPPDRTAIDPDYIDFSSFDGRLLELLEDFFSKLEQEDFQQLTYQKFKELIYKHESNGLIQVLSDQTS